METQRPTPSEAPPAREQYPAAPYSPAPPASSSRSNPFEKTPLLAAIFSLVPGLGNIYNGLYVRGLAFSALCFGLFLIGIIREEEALIPAIIFFWLFNIIDAYRQATFLNYGYSTARSRTPPVPEESGMGSGLVLGVALFLVGVYGLLTHFFDLDLEEIFQYWYVGFLGFGGWLIFQSVKKRAPEDDEPFSTEIAAAASSHRDEAEEEAA